MEKLLTTLCPGKEQIGAKALWVMGETSQIGKRLFKHFGVLTRRQIFMNTANVEFDGLSCREQQVIGRLLKGIPNKTISNELGISERTVKFHCSNIYSKMSVSGRLELITRYSD